jgi:hypothetical protein
MIKDEAYDHRKLAQEIRIIFQREKRQQLKKPYRPHPDHDTDAVWENAALKCMELEADAYSFVRAAFDHCVVSSGRQQRGPFPKLLGSKAMDRWYSAYAGISQQSREENEGVSLTPFESSVKDSIDTLAVMAYTAMNCNGTPLEHTIVDENTPAPAYARYFLMPSSSIVRYNYRTQVIEQISKNPNLGRALESLGLNITELYE